MPPEITVGLAMTPVHNTDPLRPLTVVQVASAFTEWGGMELHLLSLGAQLRQRGHRVVIAARPDGWVIQRARALGLETFEATVRRQQDWTDFARYRDFLRRERVDVLHAHTNWDAVVPAAAARRAGVPVNVLSWHLPFPFKRRLGGHLISTWLYDRMVAVSDSVRDRHVRHGVPPGKIVTIHHGTDIPAFDALTRPRAAVRAEFGLSPAHVAVGIAGRVSKEKGHRDLLAALCRLAPAHPSLRVVVIGSGIEEAPLREFAAELGVAGQVIFTGFREDVNDVLNAVDVVTVPSTWEEPCSAVVQQGMVLGKPVVGTRMGGTPEMIVENETGLLVPPSDPDSLAAALARLADDAALRARMGALGRARVEAQFSLSVMTDRIEDLYRREYQRKRRARLLPRAVAVR